MKKRIFEIGAMMFFVGTMALMSCSEDAGLGFDEEWDDMVPRTKQIYDGGQPQSPLPGGDPYYKWDLGDECLAQALALSKGWNLKYITITDYHDLVAEIMGVETWTNSIQCQYETDIRDPSSPGFDTTQEGIRDLFNCTDLLVNVSGYDFGSQEKDYDSDSIPVVGGRWKEGKKHIDYITEYRPAGWYWDFFSRKYHQPEFRTKEGWIPVSEFYYISSKQTIYVF